MLAEFIGQAMAILAEEQLDVDPIFDSQCFGVVVFTGVDMPVDKLYHLVLAFFVPN